MEDLRLYKSLGHEGWEKNVEPTSLCGEQGGKGLIEKAKKENHKVKYEKTAD